MYVVYALLDPDETDKVYYIGITDDLYERFTQHLKDIRVDSPKALWLRELGKRNRVPYCKVLEEVATQAEAKKREEHWIRHYDQLGMPLTNIAILQGPRRSGRGIREQIADKSTCIHKEPRRLLMSHSTYLLLEAMADKMNIPISAFLELLVQEAAAKHLTEEERAEVERKAQEIIEKRKREIEELEAELALEKSGVACLTIS